MLSCCVLCELEDAAVELYCRFFINTSWLILFNCGVFLHHISDTLYSRASVVSLARKGVRWLNSNTHSGGWPCLTEPIQKKNTYLTRFEWLALNLNFKSRLSKYHRVLQSPDALKRCIRCPTFKLSVQKVFYCCFKGLTVWQKEMHIGDSTCDISIDSFSAIYAVLEYFFDYFLFYSLHLYRNMCTCYSLIRLCWTV